MRLCWAAVAFPQQVSERFGDHFACRAEDLLWQMSVVEDARVATGVGVRDEGVNAMHDPTECGVWGRLVEIAEETVPGLGPAEVLVKTIFSAISHGTNSRCN